MATQAERILVTREKLFEAAGEIIALRGTQGASIAAVCAAAGYSRGSINHTFATKTQFLCALVDRVNTGWDELPIELDDEDPVFSEWFNSWATPMFQDATRSRLIGMLTLDAITANPPAWGQLLTDGQRRVAERFANALSLLRAKGQIAPPVSCDVLGHALAAWCFGLLTESCLANDQDLSSGIGELREIFTAYANA